MTLLVLASASPRRKEILEKAGLSFEVRPPCIDEDFFKGESISQYLNRITEMKAHSIKLQEKEKIILAADTIVTLGDDIIGKPKDAKDAFNTLKRLSGRTHSVFTAYNIINFDNGKEKKKICKTDVTFHTLSEKVISTYIDTQEPFGKAGSYAIQGIGCTLVEKICGCYYNVVGLPISSVMKDLIEVSELFQWIPIKSIEV